MPAGQDANEADWLQDRMQLYFRKGAYCLKSNFIDISSTRILTPDEAATLLGVAKSTIYAWVHQRSIPFRKHGRLLRFDQSTLERWSHSREVDPR
jgi:excisionase family DNA binding protein